MGGGSQIGARGGTPPPTQPPERALNYNSHNAGGHPAPLSRSPWLQSIMGTVVNPGQDGRGKESGSLGLEAGTPAQPCAHRWIRPGPGPSGSSLRRGPHFLLRPAGLHLSTPHLFVLQTG